MFSSLFKGKNNKEDLPTSKSIPNFIYKNFEFRKDNVDGVIEYEVIMVDTTADGKPIYIKKYTIKISHDISFSSKWFNLKNELTSSHFEVVPCSGIEKVTTEFKCNRNYGYNYDFNFKFWHKTNTELAAVSDKTYIYMGGGATNPEYHEGMEELFYQIQRDMQIAIENTQK
ncbi:hypothetical protein [Bacillus sp. GL1(2024)]|uniref:hypothetical protein n=1 Tax=Bacillus sp. GL1(2024) TaxID=3450427 RepID=UPI00288DF0C5|nr:hypothetical protein [Bacillus wiedmannii]